MSFQRLILISALCFAVPSEAKWKLQDHVYIIDVEQISDPQPEEVQLHCVAPGKNNASIYWKKDNSVLDVSGKIKVTGPQDAGNFTCWSNATHELLNYTTLYVAKIRGGKTKHQILETEDSSNSILRCTANNYSGNFTCSWMITSESQNWTPKFTVRAKIMYSNNTRGSVTCGEPMRDAPGRYSVSCKKEKSCISTEEYQQIQLFLHVFDETYAYENVTHQFFLKDIIKPDATECEITRDGISGSYRVTWKPPQTWSTPISYFGLMYQIKKSTTHEDTICETDNPVQLENGNRLSCSIQRFKHYQKFYIRSKDRYNKNWSEWSKPCSGGSQKNDQNHHIRDTKTEIVTCKC